MNSINNIKGHYDLSNEIFSKFLDPTMSYSSALFGSLEPIWSNLQRAQIQKYDRILNKLAINKNSHILEIGCGWGYFALNAVKKTGCKIKCITLSKEQYDYFNELIIREKLTSNIDLELIDYRKVTGTFTHVVSIEMIEAVGHEYLNDYFSVINNRLENGGYALLQAILMPEDRYKKYCKTVDFIQHYIFPGGHLPSFQAVINYSSANKLIFIEANQI